MSPKPEVTDFELRRRRAAKLTQFFGVDYRELVMDVLDSIESRLENERKGGTLRAEQLEVYVLPSFLPFPNSMTFITGSA
jgi:hypothetical protein